MIRIELLDRTFEYDVRSLTKAFFKDEDVVVVDADKNNEVEDAINYIFKVNTYRDSIELEIVSNNKEIKNIKSNDSNDKEVIVQKNNDSSNIDDRSINNGIYNYIKADIPQDIINIHNELEYKAKYKNILKRHIYRLLEETLNISLPWGTLTGIRPSKIVMELLEQGKSDEYISNYMKETYLASEDKISLALCIAHREKEILDEIEYKNGYSLYIGIPFCPTRCSYCSFTSYPLDKFNHMVEDYIDALIKEMEYPVIVPVAL